MEEEVYPLVGNDLKILQKKNLYRFGLEAVLLADFVQGKRGQKAVDLGSGDGVIPLLLAYKKKIRVMGLELQKELVDLSRRSVVMNGLEDLVEIRQLDITGVSHYLDGHSFHIVTANPPFFPQKEGRQNPDPSLAVARHELAANLEDFIAAGAFLLRAGGSFYLVHRPARLLYIFSLCEENQLEPKKMRLVYPRQNKEANIVLLKCVKGGGKGLHIMPPLVIYEGNDYSQEVQEIYLGG